MKIEDGTILHEDKELENISDFFKDIKFCKPCTIRFIVCYLEQSEILMSRLKEKTGCNIIAYNRKVNELFPDLKLPGY